MLKEALKECYAFLRNLSSSLFALYSSLSSSLSSSLFALCSLLFALSSLTHLRWLDFTLYVSSSRLGKTQTSLVLLSLRSVGCSGSASRKRVRSP